MRNPLDKREQRAIESMFTRPMLALTRALSHAAGVEDPPVRWRRVGGGPYFDNHLATLEIDGRQLTGRLERARPGDDGEVLLECVAEDRLA